MPSVRRYPAPLRDSGPESEPDSWRDFTVEFELTAGSLWLGFTGGLDDVADYWHDHADRLVAECIATHPGHRPHAWWCFDPVAAELPEIPIKNRADFDRYEEQLRARYTLINGRLLLWPYYHDVPAFLDAHGLLTDAERIELGWMPRRESAAAHRL